MQKNYTTDTVPFRKRLNKGQKPQYYVENANPAIISKELFEAAQQFSKKRMSSRNRNVKHALRVENEIKRMLERRQINKDDLRKKILESASLSYSGLNNKKYITQRLTNMFENHCPTGSFPMELFDQSVSEISFDEKDNVTITLINGQILRKEHAYAAS